MFRLKLHKIAQLADLLSGQLIIVPSTVRATMKEQVATRDLLAVVGYLAGVCAILCAVSPLRLGLLAAGCAALGISYFVAIYKFATMCAAFGVLAIRFFWLFFEKWDIKMLIGGAAALALVYLIFKNDPASSGPLSYRQDSRGRVRGGK